MVVAFDIIETEQRDLFRTFTKGYLKSGEPRRTAPRGVIDIRSSSDRPRIIPPVISKNQVHGLNRGNGFDLVMKSLHECLIDADAALAEVNIKHTLVYSDADATRSETFEVETFKRGAAPE